MLFRSIGANSSGNETVKRLETLENHDEADVSRHTYVVNSVCCQVYSKNLVFFEF